MTSSVRTASAPPAPDRQQPRTARAFRADIQGLRAVAVVARARCSTCGRPAPGGFVGVDVFFVISGFLITSHLLREADAHRARSRSRSGPAASAGCCRPRCSSLRRDRGRRPGCSCPRPVGRSRRTRSARPRCTSRTGSCAADAGRLPRRRRTRPRRCSTSGRCRVEEQFYLVWPVLMLLLVGASPAAAPLAHRRGGRRRARPSSSPPRSPTRSRATAADPAAAYFVTPTRAWELGVGALLALVAAPGRARLTPAGRARPLAWAGSAPIAWPPCVYTGATPFPGWPALLPVARRGRGDRAPARPRGRWSPAAPARAAAGAVARRHLLLGLPLALADDRARPLRQRLAPRPPRQGGASSWLTLVLAWLTKTYVEDRFRAAVVGPPAAQAIRPRPRR